MLPDLVLDFVAALFAATPTVWLVRAGFLTTLRSLSEIAHRSFWVIRSNKISDHWKEKAAPAYALKLLRVTFKLALYIIGLLLVFLVTYASILYLVSGDFGFGRLANWRTQAVIALAGVNLGLISWYRAK